MSRPTIRILLVEDDQVDRLACRRALADHPHYVMELLEADTASEGSRLARSERLDCILLDCGLPDANGLELLAELAPARGESAAPVVMLTGANEVTLAVEAMRHGASNYLVKDIEQHHLTLLPAVIEQVVAEARIRAQKREAESRLQAVANAVPGLLAYVDSDGCFRFTNAHSEAWFGVAAGALYGRLFVDFLDPEALASAQPHIEGALAGAPQAFETVALANGQPRHLYMRFQPHRDGHGCTHGFYVAAIDVTERRAAEEEVRRYQEEIERLYRQHALGAMASLFAHELNQPLTALASYTGASLRMLRAGERREQLVATLERAMEQAQRAAHIVRRVREFLRRGEIETTIEEPNALVEKIVRQAKVDAQASGVQLAFEPGNVPCVRVERAAVEKVLLNLLHNALEAIQGASVTAGGCVTVRTLTVDGALVQITVADTGPGLGAVGIERLFEPFYTTKPEGLGLGLAISRTIIEAHGGRLWTEPATRGAVFHFTVPAQR